MIGNQVINTVSWGANKQIVIDKTDVVLDAFCKLAIEHSWILSEIASGDGDTPRVLVLSNRQALVDEVVLDVEPGTSTTGKRKRQPDAAASDASDIHLQAK